jgi:hypothetical protein
MNSTNHSKNIHTIHDVINYSQMNEELLTLCPEAGKYVRALTAKLGLDLGYMELFGSTCRWITHLNLGKLRNLRDAEHFAFNLTNIRVLRVPEMHNFSECSNLKSLCITENNCQVKICC